jgi:hypothetical protein
MHADYGNYGMAQPQHAPKPTVRSQGWGVGTEFRVQGRGRQPQSIMWSTDYS